MYYIGFVITVELSCTFSYKYRVKEANSVEFKKVFCICSNIIDIQYNM